jgi:PAS domain S-box-containing protein
MVNCFFTDFSRKGIFLKAVLLTVFFLLLPAKAHVSAQDQEPLHILVLDSYNPSQPWSQAFYQGLDEARQTSDRSVHLYFEYIDKLRLTGGINHAALYAYLNAKYENIELSGIIANSNLAADFVDDYGGMLGKDAPKVVYTNHPNPAMAGDSSYFSLLEEVDQSVTETVRIALEQNPKAGSVLIIEGNNNASRNRVRTLLRQLEAHPSLSIRQLSDFSIEKLNRIVAGLDRNTIVFCTLVFSDNTGRSLVPRNVVENLAASSPAPVYSFWSTFINTGVVGGRTLDGRVVGSQLVAAVLDYLKDGRFKASYGTLNTYFDWKAVKRYGIDPDTIPGDATIINLPENLYAKYHRELVAAGIGLLLLSASAAFWLRKLSVLNGMLRQSRDELEIRVEERTWELMQSNRDLTDSENRFRNLSDAAFEGIVFIDNGIIIEANATVGQIFGCPVSEIVNRPAIDFIEPDEREKVESIMVPGYSQPYETRGLKKDGAVFPMQIYGKTFSYKGRMVQVSAVRDLTELKKTEEEIKILRGILPICASCKKIRDDQGYWNRIDKYIRDHSEAEFSHSICPECRKRLYPELDED